MFATIKYLSIIFAIALTIIPTLFDIKANTPQGGFRLTQVGWIWLTLNIIACASSFSMMVVEDKNARAEKAESDERLVKMARESSLSNYPMHSIQIDWHFKAFPTTPFRDASEEISKIAEVSSELKKSYSFDVVNRSVTPWVRRANVHYVGFPLLACLTGSQNPTDEFLCLFYLDEGRNVVLPTGRLVRIIAEDKFKSGVSHYTEDKPLTAEEFEKPTFQMSGNDCGPVASLNGSSGITLKWDFRTDGDFSQFIDSKISDFRLTARMPEKFRIVLLDNFMLKTMPPTWSGNTANLWGAIADDHSLQPIADFRENSQLTVMTNDTTELSFVYDVRCLGKGIVDDYHYGRACDVVVFEASRNH